MVDSAGLATAAAAFVLPNQPIDPATPLTRFAVPLAAVESVSGLVFFPALLSGDDKARLDKSCGKGTGKNKGAKLPLAQNAARVLAPEWHRALLAKQSAQKGDSSTDAGGRLVLEEGSWESKAAVGGAILKGGGATSVVARHLCDVADCKLPKEIWSEAKGGKRSAPQLL